MSAAPDGGPVVRVTDEMLGITLDLPLQRLEDLDEGTRRAIARDIAQMLVTALRAKLASERPLRESRQRSRYRMNPKSRPQKAGRT